MEYHTAADATRIVMAIKSHTSANARNLFMAIECHTDADARRLFMVINMTQLQMPKGYLLQRKFT